MRRVGMRVEKSVTAVTWIPSEAIEGMPKLPFELGMTHYDQPPPDKLGPGELERLREDDRFREANALRAWIEVDDGKIVDCGYSGGALVGSTTVKIGPKKLSFPGVTYPLIQQEPEVGPDWVKFVQSAGGRMGLPAPRRVRGKPFFRIASASAWTTLSLIIRADGSSEHSLEGASPFPRHWVYDKEGKLVEKSATIDFKTWYRESHGRKTPWGEEDSPAFTTAVESDVRSSRSQLSALASASFAWWARPAIRRCVRSASWPRDSSRAAARHPSRPSIVRGATTKLVPSFEGGALRKSAASSASST